MPKHTCSGILLCAQKTTLSFYLFSSFFSLLLLVSLFSLLLPRPRPHPHLFRLLLFPFFVIEIQAPSWMLTIAGRQRSRIREKKGKFCEGEGEKGR